MKLTRKQKKNLIRIAVTVPLLAVVWAISELVQPAKPLCILMFAVPYLVCGYDVILNAVRNIAHGQVFDENFLMSVATLGAFFVDEYPEAVAVMLFYQVGELFQSIAVGKSRRAVASLMDIRPDVARVVRDGEELEVSPEEVGVGECVVCRPGDKIPLDGEVITGFSAVNTAALTGESLPREVSPGDRVISGTVNLSGVIRIKVTGVYEESTVARILELVENSTEKKAKAENFITKFARVYTPVVVFSALALAVLPPLFTGISDPAVWADWVERALVFLVVSCPCALVVSVPLSFFGAIGGASRSGILIKGANYVEALADTRYVVFDKTGTLTKGTFEVVAVHPEKIGAEELLELAAAAESMSAHPIAESIVNEYGREIPRDLLDEVTERAGFGVEAKIGGNSIFVGNRKLMELCGATCRDCHRKGTVVHVASGSEYLGHIVISDTVKPDSRDAVEALHKMGVEKTVMLSGDSGENAKAVSEEVGMDGYYASLLPADKVTMVEKLLSEKTGGTLAFVGDGINDAPVLGRADVGIAMGGLGSDAAIEAADVVLMNDRPSDIPRAVSIARRTMAIVRQNIVFSLAVKAAILIASAFGMANMWLAVFADVGVMVLATLNSTRTLRTAKQTGQTERIAE